MTTANAIKKLSKYGEVKLNNTGLHFITLNGYIVSFRKNGAGENPDITCEHTCPVNEKSDISSDYFPGSYWDNLTQAIRFAEGK